MAAVDTNVLVRLLVDDDEDQVRHARAFLRAHGPAWVSHVVVAEVTWVLASAYGVDRRGIAEAVESLLSLSVVEIEEPEVVAGALESFRSSSADFGDCLILACARRANRLPLATFDAGLGRVEGARRLGAKGRRR